MVVIDDGNLFLVFGDAENLVSVFPREPSLRLLKYATRESKLYNGPGSLRSSTNNGIRPSASPEQNRSVNPASISLLSIRSNS